MRMCEIGETQIGPNGFGNVHDHITCRIPWGEDAYFGFALRIDRTVQETDARMASAWIRQHEKRSAWSAVWQAARRNAESFHGRSNFVAGQTGGGYHFGG